MLFRSRPDEAGAASTDYLRIFGLVAVGWMWLKMVKVAQAKLAEGADGKESFYDAKIKTARFFVEKMLPEVDFRFKSLMSGAKSMMDLDVDQF
mgnify:CR=1 FL=1